MDLRDYMRVLRHGWPALLTLVVLGVAAGIGITLVSEKIYLANVQIFVATSVTGNSTDLANGNTFVQDRVQSYTSIATSPEVTSAVRKQLNLTKLSDSDLAAKITADAPLNKVLINLHVTDHDPARAQRLANAVASQFDRVVQQTEQTEANGKPVVKLTVIQPATLPQTPVSPNTVLNVGLGFVLGLLVGIGIVIVRDRLDNTVKTPDDIADLGVPVLGVVPFDKRTQRMPIAFRGDPHSVRSEAFRQLRTNMQFVNVDENPRIIAVTSAVPGEGKTMTAMNLAAALAEAGYRVCLVEADLRKPTIAKTLGLVPDVGFTTVLIGKTTVDDALQNIGRNLAVLTSGPIPPNPSELLVSDQARAVIDAVAEKVEYTIIDTAPLLPVADGAEVATFADATLVVHRAGHTTRDQASRSVSALEKVSERPVGVILNMVSRRGGKYDYAYNYYYTYRPERSRHGKNAPGVESAVKVAADHIDKSVDGAGGATANGSNGSRKERKLGRRNVSANEPADR